MYNPPGDHNWVREYIQDENVFIFTCECGIRTSFITGYKHWVWLGPHKKLKFNGLPLSCTEFKMIEALE